MMRKGQSENAQVELDGGGESEYDVGFNENNMSTMGMRRLRQLYNRIFESGEDDINIEQMKL